MWTLRAQSGPYTAVRLLRVGDELGYRATNYDEPHQPVGYFRNQRAACRARRAYVRAQGPGASIVGYPQRRREPDENDRDPGKGA